MESFSTFIDFQDAVTQYYCDSNSECEITYIPIVRPPRSTSSVNCGDSYFEFVLCVRFERTNKIFEYPMTWFTSQFESLIKDLEDHMKRSYRMNYAKKWLRRQNEG